MLARRGYDAEGVETIMRSKWTRWAGDGAEQTTSGNKKSAELARFLGSGTDSITTENWMRHMGLA